MSTYKRAVRICGHDTVIKALNDLIYSEQKRGMESIAPDISKREIRKIDDLSDWLKLHGFTPDSIRFKSRLSRIVSIRRVLAYYLTVLQNYSLSDVAEMLGYAEHSSIIHHRDRFIELLEIEDKQSVDLLRTLVKQNNAEGV